MQKMRSECLWFAKWVGLTCVVIVYRTGRLMLRRNTVMRTIRTILVLLAILLNSSGAVAQTRYFPPRSLDDDSRSDEFRSHWYSAALKALDEPSLWELSKLQKGESYRFLWLRSFHHPVAVRIDVRSDGSSQLVTKMTSGAGGYEPGQLTKSTSIGLTKVQTDRFLNKLKKHAFWELEPQNRESGGCDGAEWIIEGVRDGSYRIVLRWSPMNGPVRDLGLFMLKDLARLKVPADE